MVLETLLSWPADCCSDVPVVDPLADLDDLACVDEIACVVPSLMVDDCAVAENGMFTVVNEIYE